MSDQSSQKTSSLTLRIDEKMRTNIKDAAAREQERASVLLRQLIRQGLKRLAEEQGGSR
jgi:hypothetical protein